MFTLALSLLVIPKPDFSKNMEDLNLTPMQGCATLIQNAYRAPIDREENQRCWWLCFLRGMGNPTGRL